MKVAVLGPRLAQPRSIETLRARACVAFALLCLSGCSSQSNKQEELSSSTTDSTVSSTTNQTSSDVDASSSTDTSSEALPGSDAGAFFGTQDPSWSCVPKSSGLGWELRLKRGPFDPRPSVALSRKNGGVFLAGMDQGSTWLGAVSSKGDFVASAQLTSGSSFDLESTGLVQTTQGELLLAGFRETDLVHFTEAGGIRLKPASLHPDAWSVLGPLGAPGKSLSLASNSKGDAVVAGFFGTSKTSRIGFVDKLSPAGQRVWRVPTEIPSASWPFTMIYDLEVAADDSIYAIGAVQPKGTRESERAALAKLDQDGSVVWMSYLEPEAALDEKGFPTQTSISRQIALAAEGTELWAIGSVGAPGSEERQGRAWRVGTGDGKVLGRIDVQTAPGFGRHGVSGFTALVVSGTDLYYAWSANQYVGEDFTGIHSQIARMKGDGTRTWSVDFTRDRGPGQVSNVRIMDLVADGYGGVYAIGTRYKVLVPDKEPQGDLFGYAARFCPQ